MLLVFAVSLRVVPLYDLNALVCGKMDEHSKYSAVEPVADIELSGDGVVSFVSGDGVGDQSCLLVTLIGDNILEYNETHRLSIASDSSNRGIVRVGGGPVNITITDDDSKYVVCIEITSPQA